MVRPSPAVKFRQIWLMDYKPYTEDGRLCWRPWRSAVVNWDGGFAPCCYLTDKTQDFGDLNQSSVKEIWNNDRYRAARALYQKSFVPGEWTGCLDCSVYQGSKAARRRGPVGLHPGPAVLQTNGAMPVNGNGATPKSGLSGPETIYVSQNGRGEKTAAAKTK